jgi:hypothetical protein
MIRNFMQECDYSHGYQKALLDVRDFFERRSVAMKVLHLYNKDGLNLILKGMVENAEEMQELGGDIEFEISDEKVGNKIIHKSIKVCKMKG